MLLTLFWCKIYCATVCEKKNKLKLVKHEIHEDYYNVIKLALEKTGVQTLFVKYYEMMYSLKIKNIFKKQNKKKFSKTMIDFSQSTVYNYHEK